MKTFWYLSCLKYFFVLLNYKSSFSCYYLYTKLLVTKLSQSLTVTRYKKQASCRNVCRWIRDVWILRYLFTNFQKIYRLFNAFWLHQHRVKCAPFWQFSIRTPCTLFSNPIFEKYKDIFKPSLVLPKVSFFVVYYRCGFVKKAMKLSNCMTNAFFMNFINDGASSLKRNCRYLNLRQFFSKEQKILRTFLSLLQIFLKLSLFQQTPVLHCVNFYTPQNGAQP